MTSPSSTTVNFRLQLELNSPLQVARWRPLVHWFLLIPQFIVL
jgi:hypothetical protein